MKKILLVLISVLTLSINAHAYDRGDFQIWNTDTEEINVFKGVKAAMEQEFRFGDNAGEYFYQHYEFGFLYGFDKILDLFFGYRLVLERFKHKWREEDMPCASATLKYDTWGFKLEDKNRLEYRHFRFKDDSIRYRNKFTLKYSIDVKRLKIKLSPYASDEILVSSDGTGYNENRFTAGAEIGLNKYCKIDLYYMLKENRLTGDKWTFVNVLGTKAKISF